MEILIISLVLLLAIGLGVFFLIRYLRQKNDKKVDFDYTTERGLRVKLSPHTEYLEPEVIDEWIDSVVSFWEEKKGWPREKSLAVIKKFAVIIYDQVFLNRAGIKVVGITHYYDWLIEIACFPKEPDPGTPVSKLLNSKLEQFDFIQAITYDNGQANIYLYPYNSVNINKIEDVLANLDIAFVPKNITELEPSGNIFNKVKSLMRHESSHVLATAVGGIPLDNEVHHKLFAEVGLGA